MNITRFTDYSLRTLIYLSIHDQELATIRQIANRYQISKNHLMKIVQALNIKGYLVAIRGKNGGVKLSRAPNQINLGQLVREIEQHSALVECFDENNQCVITPACQLKTIFAQAMEHFFQCLDQYTLADLVADPSRQQLGKILAFDTRPNATDAQALAIHQQAGRGK